MAQLKVMASNGHAIHEGNTKHYSATLLTFHCDDDETAWELSILIRAHGSVGKASRHGIESFNGTSVAKRTYDKLLDDKQKRGYTNISLSRKICLSSVIDIEEVKKGDEWLAVGEFGEFFTKCEITANTSPRETLLRVLTAESIQFLHTEVKRLIELGDNSSSTAAKSKKKESSEAAMAAAMALQAKRTESYGAAWGSW